MINQWILDGDGFVWHMKDYPLGARFSIYGDWEPKQVARMYMFKDFAGRLMLPLNWEPL